MSSWIFLCRCNVEEEYTSPCFSTGGLEVVCRFLDWVWRCDVEGEYISPFVSTGRLEVVCEFLDFLCDC